MTSAPRIHRTTTVAQLHALLDHHSPRPTFQQRVDVDEFCGGIPQVPAHAPSVRIGRHWVSFAWLAVGALVALAVIVAVAMQLRTYGWVQSFIAHYPGTSASYAQPVTTGFPAWLRWQHFFNIVFMMFIIRSGLQILADHPRLYPSTPDAVPDRSGSG